MSEKPVYWVRLQYDPDQDHFLIDGSFESMRQQAHVTGYKGSQVLHLYEQELMHEIEVLKRQQRKTRAIIKNDEHVTQNSEEMAENSQKIRPEGNSGAVEAGSQIKACTC
jgi:hypothetical protein